MPVVFVWLAVTLYGIGVTIYKIAEWIYNVIIKPIKRIVDFVKDIEDTIRATIDVIQKKLEYVLDVTGIDAILSLVKGVDTFLYHTTGLAKGGKKALLATFASVYETIAGVTSGLIHFISESIKPITERITMLQTNIKHIQEWSIKDLTDEYVELGEEIRAMPERMMTDIRSEIEKESQLIKDGFAGKLAIVNVRLTGVIALSEDLKHFAEMFIKVMEE